jgi:hypothetical protein
LQAQASPQSRQSRQQARTLRKSTRKGNRRPDKEVVSSCRQDTRPGVNLQQKSVMVTDRSKPKCQADDQSSSQLRLCLSHRPYSFLLKSMAVKERCAQTLGFVSKKAVWEIRLD